MLNVKGEIKSLVSQASSPHKKLEVIQEIRNLLHELSPLEHQPIDMVHWIPIDQIQANDYNPNAVATIEMKLLYVSISHDGYTQPVVTIWNEEIQKYVIVDGFHRYSTMLRNKDLQEKNHGLLPIVVINKTENERMAATVRHNRARGKHSIAGMANIVFSMLDNGWQDSDICNHLGMEPEELLRLKHVTGFSKLFENIEYRKAWESKSQIKLRIKAERNGIKTLKTSHNSNLSR